MEDMDTPKTRELRIISSPEIKEIIHKWLKIIKNKESKDDSDIKHAYNEGKLEALRKLLTVIEDKEEDLL